MSRMRKLAIPLYAAVALVAAAASADRAQPAPLNAGLIQLMIESAAPGTVIAPPPGRYAGHLLIDRPVVLDGRGMVTLDGENSGSVVEIQVDGVTMRGFRLINSGSDHNGDDAAVKIKANHAVIVDNVIGQCLEGINLSQSNDNIVRGNRISSKEELSLGLKGDAIKLWYSNNNTIDGNTIVDSRDVVVWYSHENTISKNISHHGRYGLHFMYAGQNTVVDNQFYDNSVGISMMYSEGVVIRRNRIADAVGSTGTCIAAKESSGLRIEDNDIIYCSQGIYLDVSPYQPDEVNIIRGNRISFDDIGVAFLSDWHDNEFRDNVIKGNMTQVAVFGGGGARNNVWDGNFWDTYEGFDRDRDGVGDSPFVLMGYASRVWMDIPSTRFFKGTPLLEVLDFLDRLAPFSQPTVMLEDDHPRMTPSVSATGKAPAS